jgi:hypothetical protein
VFPRRVGDKHIEPGNSWAKFRFTHSGNPYAAYNPNWIYTFFSGFRFYFLWTNPRDTYTVINVGSTLTLNGYCETSSEGMWYGGARYSGLKMFASLTPHEWWKQPPTPLYARPYPQVVDLSTSTGGWFEEDASDSAAVSEVYWRGYNLMLVPPRAVAGFEVMCSFEGTTGADSGLIEVDFASGDFEIMCPGVYLQMVS